MQDDPNSMAEASQLIENWQPLHYTLTTRARAGQSVELAEFPWLAAKRLLAAVHDKLAPALRDFLAAWHSGEDEPEQQREAGIVAVLERHAPLLLEAPELAEELIKAVSVETDSSLARLNSRDIASLAILALRLLLLELTGGLRFFSAELSFALLASSGDGQPATTS